MKRYTIDDYIAEAKRRFGDKETQGLYGLSQLQPSIDIERPKTTTATLPMRVTPEGMRQQQGRIQAEQEILQPRPFMPQLGQEPSIAKTVRGIPQKVLDIAAIPFRPFEAAYQTQAARMGGKSEAEIKVKQAQALAPELFGKDQLEDQAYWKALGLAGISGNEALAASIPLFLSEMILAPGGMQVGAKGANKIRDLSISFKIAEKEAEAWIKGGKIPQKVTQKFAEWYKPIAQSRLATEETGHGFIGFGKKPYSPIPRKAKDLIQQIDDISNSLAKSSPEALERTGVGKKLLEERDILWGKLEKEYPDIAEKITRTIEAQVGKVKPTPTIAPKGTELPLAGVKPAEKGITATEQVVYHGTPVPEKVIKEGIKTDLLRTGAISTTDNPAIAGRFGDIVEIKIPKNAEGRILDLTSGKVEADIVRQGFPVGKWYNKDIIEHGARVQTLIGFDDLSIQQKKWLASKGYIGVKFPSLEGGKALGNEIRFVTSIPKEWMQKHIPKPSITATEPIISPKQPVSYIGKEAGEGKFPPIPEIPKKPILPTKVYHSTLKTYEGLPKSAEGIFGEKRRFFGEPEGVFYNLSPEEATRGAGLTKFRDKVKTIEAIPSAENPLIITSENADRYQSLYTKTGRELGFTDNMIYEQGFLEEGKQVRSVSEELPTAFAEKLKRMGYDAVYDTRNGDYIVLKETAIKPTPTIKVTTPTKLVETPSTIGKIGTLRQAETIKTPKMGVTTSEQGIGQIPPPEKPPAPPVSPELPPPLNETMERMGGVLKKARGRRPEIVREYKKQLGRKWSAYGEKLKGGKGESAFVSAEKSLTGKMERDPTITATLIKGDRDNLFEAIRTSPRLMETEKQAAKTGLTELLDFGRIPQPAELVKLEAVFGKEFSQQLITNRAVIKDLFISASNLLKSVMTGFIPDMGAVGVQNIVYTARHPVMTAKNVARTLYENRLSFREFIPNLQKFMGNLGLNKPTYQNAVKIADDVFQKQQFSKWYDDLYKSTDYLTEIKPYLDDYIVDPYSPAAGIMGREEATMAYSITEQIPVIGELPKLATRWYNSLMNRMRVDKFRLQSSNLKKMGIFPDTPPEEVARVIGKHISGNEVYKSLGRTIGTVTGRPALTSSHTVNEALTVAFYSPRNIISTWKSVFSPLAAPKPVRMMAYKDLAIALGGLTGLVSTMGLYLKASKKGSVGYNPNSADFMKIRVGRERINPLGRYQSMARAMAQLWTAKNVSSTTGKKTKVSRPEVVKRYLANKLNPTIVLLGEETGILRKYKDDDEFWEKVAPMMITDIYDSVDEFGLASGMTPLTAGLSWAGFNVNVYGRKRLPPTELSREEKAAKLQAIKTRVLADKRFTPEQRTRLLEIIRQKELKYK